MYFKLVIAVLVLVSVTFAADKECRKCKPDEVFSTCGGCDGTCANPDPICTLQCRTGCFCPGNNVRDSEGRCIPRERCHPEYPECKPGEVYTECGTCDKSCDNPDLLCTQQCRKGCFCAKDYVRTSAGRCIPSKECRKHVDPEKSS